MATEKKNKGFRVMDPDEQKRIASKGGKAAHAKGRAHEWTVEEARAAGRKGGAAGERNRRGQFQGAAAETVDPVDTTAPVEPPKA